MIDLDGYLNTQSHKIEQQLERMLAPHPGAFHHLYEAARYATLGAGKRLRPILTLATAEMFGLDPADVIAPACAIELIHAYSMIHDDLPCMDNDDYRRGKLTVHRRYSEGLAVLTGDFLLTFAFELLAADTHLSPITKVHLIKTLARRSGGEGMIGGQVMDIDSEGKKITLDTLRQIHRYKTAALLTASVEFGGILANAPAEHLSHLEQFGEHIGLAFQILDDILDVTSSESKHGKAIASDVINQKSTFVSLMGIEQSHIFALRHYDIAIESLKRIPYNTSLLIQLADYMIRRKK